MTEISTTDLEVGQALRVNDGEIIAKFAAEHVSAVLDAAKAFGTVLYADEYVFMVEAPDGSVGAFAKSTEGDWWEARMNVTNEAERSAIVALANTMRTITEGSLPE